MDLLAQSSLRNLRRYHVVPCNCFSLCVKWDGPSLKLDRSWWLTEEIFCCQNSWKCQKEMTMFLYIFLNCCFESVFQMFREQMSCRMMHCSWFSFICVLLFWSQEQAGQAPPVQSFLWGNNNNTEKHWEECKSSLSSSLCVAAALSDEGCLHRLLLFWPMHCKNLLLGKSFVNYASWYHFWGLLYSTS